MSASAAPSAPLSLASTEVGNAYSPQAGVIDRRSDEYEIVLNLVEFSVDPKKAAEIGPQNKAHGSSHTDFKMGNAKANNVKVEDRKVDGVKADDAKVKHVRRLAVKREITLNPGPATQVEEPGSPSKISDEPSNAPVKPSKKDKSLKQGVRFAEPFCVPVVMTIIRPEKCSFKLMSKSTVDAEGKTPVKTTTKPVSQMLMDTYQVVTRYNNSLEAKRLKSERLRQQFQYKTIKSIIFVVVGAQAVVMLAVIGLMVAFVMTK